MDKYTLSIPGRELEAPMYINDTETPTEQTHPKQPLCVMCVIEGEGWTYNPHPLLGDAGALDDPEGVHEPAAVARVLGGRAAHVEQGRAVGAGRQAQHLHQGAHRLVPRAAALLG